MSYQVLSLKYRPQTFDEVIGQDHVTTTLKNAVSSDRVAHAVLFTGPRGTGKTTIARILAKAMNCKNGPTSHPCNICRICKDIVDGHCTDVFEIDGASNNSVDQVRDLRENVAYMPSSAKYKIYIIDEVHMLSTAAFNALLKTLEEPPDHVIFIFATTEVHKIPATILSRCQRHDLSRVSLELISGHLENLSEKEGFALSKESIDLIAREADGSIRDSLSLLDRIISSTPEKIIDSQWVYHLLGVLDHRLIQDMGAAILQKDGTKMIELIENAYNSGFDLKKYYSDIILYFRNLSVIRLCGKKSPALNISDSERETLDQASEGIAVELLHSILQILLQEEGLIRYSSHTRIALETALLKLLRIDSGERIDELIRQLDMLARQIGSMEPSRPAVTPHDEKMDLPRPDEDKAIHPVAEKNIPASQSGLEPPVRSYEGSDKQKTWDGFLKLIEQTHPFIYALFSKGRIKEIPPDEIRVELKNCSSFDKQRLENKENELKQRCKEYLHKNLFLEISLQTEKLDETGLPSQKNENKARLAALNHPLVAEAKRLFNGEIINP